MTTPTIREVPAISAATNAAVTVNLSSAVVAGDTVIIFHGTNNAVTYANLDSVATTLSWTQFGTYGSMTTSSTPQLKGAYSALTASGAQSITVAQESTAAHNLCVVVLVGTCTLDVSAGAAGAVEGEHDAPSVDPVVTDGLMICAVQSRGPDAATDYSTPSGFTMRAEVTGTNPMAVASKVLSSGAPTGTVRFSQTGSTWDMYKSMSSVWVGSGGSAYNQSVAGGATPTGALVRATSRTVVGSATPTGVARRALARALAGSTTPTAAISRALSRTLAGATTPTGMIVRALARLLGGSTSPAGTASRVTARALSGGTTPSGATAKGIAKSLSGSTAPTGSVTRAIAKTLGGGIGPSGLINRALARLLGGSATPAGSVATSATTEVVPGTLHATLTAPSLATKSTTGLTASTRPTSTLTPE